MEIIIPDTANVWIGFLSVILEGEVFANTAAGDFIPHVVTVYTGEVMQKPVCVVVFFQIYVMMYHLALVFLSNFDRSFWFGDLDKDLVTFLLCRMLLERSCHLLRRVQEESVFSLPMELSQMSPYANPALLVAY